MKRLSGADGPETSDTVSSRVAVGDARSLRIQRRLSSLIVVLNGMSESMSMTDTGGVGDWAGLGRY